MAVPGEGPPLSSPVLTDLSALWLPLLQRLTEVCSNWGIWKNADACFSGSGDMDSAAPEKDWDVVVSEFRRWAVKKDLGPVTACRHVQGVLFILALNRRNSEFVELDVNAKKYFRGWTMFRSENLAPLMELDPRGFRRLRPGAEGIMLLLGNGTKWGGRPNPEGLQRKRIPETLRRDPEGVKATAACLFGPAANALVRVAERAAIGQWDHRNMLEVEAWALANALIEPRVALSRIKAKRIKRMCPVLRTIFSENRRRPIDLDSWLNRVHKEHPVYE